MLHLEARRKINQQDMEGTESISLLREKHVSEDIKEKRGETAAETEANVGDKQKGGLKKPKEGTRQKNTANHTVPRPFLLATEKRMSIERRRSADFNELQPRVSKSFSFNKVRSPSKAREPSKADQTSSTSAITKSVTTRVSSTKGEQNGVRNQSKNLTEEIEGKSSQVPSKMQKHQREASENGKPENSSTFKALPLPSFYQKNDNPVKIASNKVPVTEQKSPPVSRGTKPSKSVEDKRKINPTSRTISNRARETIGKILKSTQKVLNPSKPSANAIAATA